MKSYTTGINLYHIHSTEYRPHLIGSVNLAFNCQMTVRTGKLCIHVDRRVTRVMVQAHSPNRQEHSPEQTVK